MPAGAREPTVQTRVVRDGGAHADEDCVVARAQVVRHGLRLRTGEGGGRGGREGELGVEGGCECEGGEGQGDGCLCGSVARREIRLEEGPVVGGEVERVSWWRGHLGRWILGEIQGQFINWFWKGVGIGIWEVGDGALLSD